MATVKGDLQKSAKAMEESFFARENEKLLQKLRAESEAQHRRESLQEMLQIDNELVLDRLVELDLCAETIAAFTVIPLVEVAWADGTMSPKERQAILDAAAERGISAGSTNYQLLQNWLDVKPETRLFEVWQHYAQELLKGLDPDTAAELRQGTIARTTEVAKAAGGFLGINKISDEEQAVLDLVAATLT
jgi:tellurite resistance protein